MTKGYLKSYKQALISWTCMHSRCYKKYDKDYNKYGGRGITVCEDWHDFANFVRDMGFPPDDPKTGERMTLDRINGDDSYSKNNCRWATRSQQNKNRDYFRFKVTLGDSLSPTPDFELTLEGKLITLRSSP